MASNREFTERATALLIHVGNDLDDIHNEMLLIQDEMKTLADKEQDALWAGDPIKANGIRYQIMLKNKMRILLKIRKRILRREMETKVATE